MAETLAMTRFADWLRARLPHDVNQSQLALYIGTTSSAVNAWYTRGVTPSPALCRKIAEYLRIPVEDVMRAAGHLPALAEEPAPYDDQPPWVALISGLSEQDRDYIGRLVESAYLRPIVPDEPSSEPPGPAAP